MPVQRSSATARPVPPAVHYLPSDMLHSPESSIQGAESIRALSLLEADASFSDRLESHDLIQTLMAQIGSVDSRSPEWDEQLSALQDLSLQLSSEHHAGIWPLLEGIQGHLAQVVADFADYIEQRAVRQRAVRQHATRQQGPRHVLAHHQQALQQLLGQRAVVHHQQDDRQQHRRQQQASALGSAPLTVLAPLLGALQLPHQPHHRQHRAGDSGLEPLGCMLQVVGQVLRHL